MLLLLLVLLQEGQGEAEALFYYFVTQRAVNFGGGVGRLQQDAEGLCLSLLIYHMLKLLILYIQLHRLHDVLALILKIQFESHLLKPSFFEYLGHFHILNDLFLPFLKQVLPKPTRSLGTHPLPSPHLHNLPQPLPQDLLLKLFLMNFRHGPIYSRYSLGPLL